MIPTRLLLDALRRVKDSLNALDAAREAEGRGVAGYGEQLACREPL